MYQYLRRYVQTLLHLRPWQIFGRVLKPLQRRAGLPPLRDPPEDLTGGLQTPVQFPNHAPWNARDELLEGRFCFLNRSKVLGWPPDWGTEGPSLLWRFNLHYFQYLHLLSLEEQKRLCRSWIDAEAPGSAVSWHPYPTSLRIVNWCRANLRDDNVQQSLYRQAAYLYRHRETHVMGNHLLENARALVYAGIFFGEQGEAERWLDRGLQIYRDETPEQILSDGGHYERSPMYQALVLEGYLDVCTLLPVEHPDRSWLKDAAASMMEALRSLTYPNGRLALFNDATREIAPDTATLLQYADNVVGRKTKQRASLPESGYYVHEGDSLHCIIDGGRAGPDHLMAHAHADIFSYELCVENCMFVVDTGVYEYRAGDMRDYVRSTAAHNTVSIDRQSQIDPWNAFRVGRRAAPYNVTYDQLEERSTFSGAFDGYDKILGENLVHRRQIVIDEVHSRLRVDDKVCGDGTHYVESRVHLHPRIEIKQHNESAYRLQHERGVEGILNTSGAEVEIECGRYCPEFGKAIDRPVIVFKCQGTLPVHISYQIKLSD